MAAISEYSSSSAIDGVDPHSLDGWLAVKENLFKPELQQFKLRPNIHVCWNPNESKYCVTFNEHSRVQSDTQQRCSFASLFGLDDLKNIRMQFSYLCGAELDERYFPSAALLDSMNSDARSSWLDYIFRSRSLSPEIMDKLSIPMEEYLSEAYRRLTHFTFLSVLYPDDFNFDQYFENLSELRHKYYVERLEKAKQNLECLLKAREEQKRVLAFGKNGGRMKRRTSLGKSTMVMEDVAAVGEDEASPSFEPAVSDLGAAFCDQLRCDVWDLLEVTGEYFTYLKQPFLDMRELAGEKIRHARNALDSTDYGDRVKTRLKERLPHWKQEYSNSVENLRDLQFQYFEETKQILHQYRDGLQSETRPPHRSYYFTTSSFKEQKMDAERRLAFENVNYWTTVIQRLKAERKQVIAQVSHIDLTASNLDELVRRLEDRLFRVQARYLEANVQLLHEKDQYLKLQLKEIRQKAVLTVENGDQDGEDVFFDAVESELELQRFLEMYSSSQPKLYALKTELESVHRQKAALRNKKKKLEAAKRDGQLLTSMATSEQSPELSKVIEIEQQRQTQLRDDRMRQQRTVTLQRIKDYRTKNPQLSRSGSNRSLASSIMSSSRQSLSSSRTSLKSKSPSVAALQSRANSQTRRISTKQEPRDELWSVSRASTPASKTEPAVTRGTVGTTAPIPPPPPPPAPPPAPLQTGTIPPAPPPPPPPPPPMCQPPASFFVPLGGNAPAKKAAPSGPAPMDSILHAIKNGVQLKPVDTMEVEERKRKQVAKSNGKGDTHSQLLKELMNRMSKMAMVSSSDSESDSEFGPSRKSSTAADDEFDDD